MKWDHLQVSFPQPRHPLLCREEVARGPVTLLLSPQVPPQALLLAVSTLRARCPGDGPWGPSLFATPGKNGREKKGLPRSVAAGLSPLLTAPPSPVHFSPPPALSRPLCCGLQPAHLPFLPSSFLVSAALERVPAAPG